MRNDRLRKIRYQLGNAARLSSWAWRQSNVQPEFATNIFACGFGDNGWHHLRLTLEEIDNNPDIRPELTTLWRYLKFFQPDNITGLAGIRENRLPLFVYPWGTFKKGVLATDKQPELSRFCGPSDDSFIANEFYRIRKLYFEMKRTGYKPTTYPNSFIGGTWLIDAKKRKRFVVLQGNHRMAVLSHLGYKKISVRTMPGYLGKIHELNINSWPLVANRTCSKEDACKIFRLYFNECGFHILKYI